MLGSLGTDVGCSPEAGPANPDAVSGPVLCRDSQPGTGGAGPSKQGAMAPCNFLTRLQRAQKARAHKPFFALSWE